MKLISIILLLTFSLNSFAESAVRLVQGQAAPYAGVLLPEAMANDMKKDLLDADYNKAVVESYKKSIELYKANELLYQSKVDLYSTQNDKLAESLQSERSISNWGRLAWFLLGIGATVGAGYAISRVK